MKTLTIFLRYSSVRFFYLIFGLLIIAGGYINTFPQITVNGKVFINPFFSIAEGVPNWIYGVMYFIALFIVATFFIFFLILVYNWVKVIKEKTRFRYMDLFVNNLFNYFFSTEEYSDEDKSEKLKLLKKTINSDYAKRLFISTLSRVKTQTIGVTYEKATNLFNVATKKSLIKAYLYSPYLRHKLFALRTIADFGMEGYDNYIVQLTKRKNNVLRNEALVTLIKLNVYDNLEFLVNMNVILTMWDINSIIKAIKQNKKQNIQYLPLIQSKVPELSVLGIMLARINNRNDFKLEIKNKIGDESELVNEEAFRTYLSFSNEKADLDFLMTKYDLAPESIRKLIIKALSKYPDKAKTIEFLDKIVQKKPFPQKIEAIKLLLDIDISALSRYKDSENLQIRQSYLQVLDINL